MAPAPSAVLETPCAEAYAPKAEASKAVDCVAVPMAMLSPPLAVVATKDAPSTSWLSLPMAMLPLVWEPLVTAVVAWSPSLMSPVPLAVLSAPLAVL